MAYLAVAAAGLAQPSSEIGDTFAVIVSTSRFWFNYRHGADALSVYHAVRRLGVPDSRIVLMLAENPGGSAHNPTPGRVYAIANDRLGGDVLSEDAQVDYAGAAVTSDALVRVLTGRHRPGTPRSQRLLTGRSSRILLYLTGHGGDGFLKFHDKDELAAGDLAAALRSAEAAGRFGEVLLLLDTCQASTLAEPLGTAAADDTGAVWRRALRHPDDEVTASSSLGWPGDLLSDLWSALFSDPTPAQTARSRVGIIALGSSRRGEDSLGAQADAGLGMAVADEFSQLVYAVLRSAFSGAFTATPPGVPVVWDPALLPQSQQSPLGPAYSDLLRESWDVWRTVVDQGVAVRNEEAAKGTLNGTSGVAVVGARLLSSYCSPSSAADLMALPPERIVAVQAWCEGRSRIEGFQRRGMSAACASHTRATGRRDAESAACNAQVRARTPGRLYDAGPHLALPALDAMLQQRQREAASSSHLVHSAETQPSLIRLWPAEFQRKSSGNAASAVVLPRVSSSVSARVDLVAEARIAADAKDAAEALASQQAASGDSVAGEALRMGASANILEGVPLLDFFGAPARLALSD